MTRSKNDDRRIAVLGAYGHTGRFVVGELRRRGWIPVLCGRDSRKLVAMGGAEEDRRVALIDDPASLDSAIGDAAAVINCAGPFLDTADAVAEAAIRARIHYFDLAAEQVAVLEMFEHFSEAARIAGMVGIPGMAFYGGLADLLATAAMGDWKSADEVLIAVALDSWHPTVGTRRTGERNTTRRVVVSGNKLVPLAAPPPERHWDFPQPFGLQQVVGLPLSEIISISRHLGVGEVQSFMNLIPLEDLRNPDTPPPAPADESGRSAQTFLVDVIVRNGKGSRRATARGRDIYAVSASLVVEAAERVIRRPPAEGGIFAPGEIFDAGCFLRSLSSAHFMFEVA